MADRVSATGAEHPRAVLAELEQRAKKRFGQHFLARPSVCERMVRSARVVPGDRVLEVGPGLGILTEALVAAGAEVTAIEIDPTLATRLAERLPQVRVVQADATRADWSELLPGGGWKVVANLPYNVGTGLVMDLLRSGRVASITAMLQAEVVGRMVAGAGDELYGALSVEVALRAGGAVVASVPPEAFVPPPKVHSLVVHLVVHPVAESGGLDPADVDRVVRAAFAQRRKTVRNSLAATFGAARTAGALAAAGVDPGARAEVLDRAAFVALARALAERDGCASNPPASPTSG